MMTYFFIISITITKNNNKLGITYSRTDLICWNLQRLTLYSITVGTADNAMESLNMVNEKYAKAFQSIWFNILFW